MAGQVHGGRGSYRDVVRRLFRDPAAVAGLAVIFLTLVVALFASWIAPHSPTDQTLALRAQPPSLEHPFGLDGVGRDILSRVVYGASYTVGGSLLAVSLATSAGVCVGLAAGYLGGAVDRMLMRTADLMLAFPSILVAILLVTFLGPDLLSAVLAVGVAAVPGYARIVRGLTLAIREREFIHAAIASGAGTSRIVTHHVLPNAISPIIVYSSLEIGSAIIRLASLSFLGLGAQPPTPEWGAMLNSAQQWLTIAPHISLVPGIAISLVVLSFNVVGDGLRDVLDPQLST